MKNRHSIHHQSFTPAGSSVPTITTVVKPEVKTSIFGQPIVKDQNHKKHYWINYELNQ